MATKSIMRKNGIDGIKELLCDNVWLDSGSSGIETKAKDRKPKRKKSIHAQEHIDFANNIDYTDFYAVAKLLQGTDCVFSAPNVVFTDKYPNDANFSGIFVRFTSQCGLRVDGKILHGSGEPRLLAHVIDETRGEYLRDCYMFGCWYTYEGWWFWVGNAWANRLGIPCNPLRAGGTVTLTYADFVAYVQASNTVPTR